MFGTQSDLMNELLQFIAGVFVNGPYALITTAVSAELGTQIQSKSALATVSSIIDGTGSIGAAIGPSLSGIVASVGWKYVFYMVMIADLFALISLLRISCREFRRLRRAKEYSFSASSQDELCVKRI